MLQKKIRKSENSIVNMNTIYKIRYNLPACFMAERTLKAATISVRQQLDNAIVKSTVEVCKINKV